MTAVLTLAMALSLPDPAPAGDPFDLSFIPPDRPTRLVAVRPAAFLNITEQPVGDLDAAVATAVAAVVTALGGEPTGGGLPSLRDFSQVMTTGLNVLLPSSTARGHVAFGFGWWVFRTADPFDWAGLAAGWFPAGEERRHSNRPYRRVKVPVRLFGDEAAEKLGEHEIAVHFYAADSRTLVVSFDEDEVKQVIDRQAAGRAVTPPPLWDTVERWPLAVAADTDADRGWLTIPDELPADRPAVGVFADLLRATGAAAVGLDLSRDRLRLTAAASASDLPGLTDKLRAAFAQVTGGRVWMAAGRVTASLSVSADEARAAVAGDDDE